MVVSLGIRAVVEQSCTKHGHSVAIHQSCLDVAHFTTSSWVPSKYNGTTAEIVRAHAEQLILVSQ